MGVFKEGSEEGSEAVGYDGMCGQWGGSALLIPRTFEVTYACCRLLCQLGLPAFWLYFLSLALLSGNRFSLMFQGVGIRVVT